MTRLLPALSASLLLVASSPFIGEARNLLAAAFPTAWVGIVLAGVGTSIAAAASVAVLRIRRDRAFRYGALAAAFLLFGLHVMQRRTGNADVDAVELFHFLEYGLITFLFYRAVRPSADLSVPLLTLLYGLLVGTIEEWLQWFVPGRTGEIGDVLLNGHAVLCGLLFSVGLLPPENFRWTLTPGSRRASARLAAIVILAVAAFFHSAHAGYEIQDPEVGRFRSYFTADQLAHLNVIRGEEWSRNPPVGFPMLGKQDYFLTEGGWHAQRRNEGYAGGDFVTAWNENRILERHYSSFLRLRSFVSGDPQRWAPAQRDEVAAGVVSSPTGTYVSPAGRDRIYLRPTKTAIWLIAVTAATVVVMGGGRSRGRAGGEEFAESVGTD